MDGVWYIYRQDDAIKILTKKRGPLYAKGRGPINTEFPEYLTGIEKGSFLFPQVYAAIQAAGKNKQ